MNPETNKLEPLQPLPDGSLLRPDGTPVPKHWAIFTLGEHVVIKDYTFKVCYLGETAVLFEPVAPQLVGAKELR